MMPDRAASFRVTAARWVTGKLRDQPRLHDEVETLVIGIGESIGASV